MHESVDGGVLSSDQFERLKSELEALYSGAGNAGRPLLLEGGLRWQAMSLSPADMDFAALKALAARDIVLAFGVPPMLIGLPGDSTYANYREANRALWRMTVLPLAEKILRGLSATGRRAFGVCDNGAVIGERWRRLCAEPMRGLARSSERCGRHCHPRSVSQPIRGGSCFRAVASNGAMRRTPRCAGRSGAQGDDEGRSK